MTNQERAALAQQAEPTGKESLQVESVVAENATTQQQIEQTPPSEYRRGYWAGFAIGKREGRIEAEDELAQQAEPVAFDWPRKACPCRDVQNGECLKLGCKWERDPSLVPEALRRQAGMQQAEHFCDTHCTWADHAPGCVRAGPVELVVEFDHGIGADRYKVVRGSYWWHLLIGDSPIRRGKFHTQAGAEEMAALLLREFRNGAFVQHKTALAQQAEPRNQCRSDGRCQYAIDHGAEGMGHCPKGKCVMAQHTQPAEDRAVAQSNLRVMKEMFREQAEPVAWRVRGYNQFKTGEPRPWRYVDGTGKPAINTPDCCDFEPLYTTPPQQAEPVQEPVAIADGTFNHDCPIGTLLYTTPPPRKPLTVEGILEMAEKAWKPSVYCDAEALLGTDGLVALVRAVEAKHGIKE